MCRRKYNKIETNIIESLKYAALGKFEADHQSAATISQVARPFRKKQNRRYEEKHDELMKARQQITLNNKHKPKLIAENKIESALQKLAKTPDYLKRKYNIAFALLLDPLIGKQYEHPYLNELSLLLFGDKKALSLIQKEISEMYHYLNGSGKISRALSPALNFVAALPGKLSNEETKEEEKASSPTEILSATALASLLSVAKSKTGALFLNLAARGAGFAARRYLLFRRDLSKVAKLTEDDVLFMLLAVMVELTYAQTYLDAVFFQKQFNRKLKTVNVLRSKVMKELFEEWYERAENIRKVQLFNNFDNYLIKKLKFQQR